MRTTGLLALLMTSCTMPGVVGEGPESDTGGTSDDPTATGSGSDQSASDDGVDGDTGIVPDGPYVDCAMLGPDQPTIGPGEPGPLGFPEFACNPRTSGEANGFQCCSSDPATADGQLPAYANKTINGSTPLYADAANDAGIWGMCVRTADIPAGSGLLTAAAMNCPIPCNPRWDAQDVETVCGADRSCCQTIELGPKDCVLDDGGLWRPVSGEDIGSSTVSPATNWNSVAHDTHQDPNGTVCLGINGGDPSSAEFQECILGLNVADERGFCMGLSLGQSCPGILSGYIDACEAMNN